MVQAEPIGTRRRLTTIAVADSAALVGDELAMGDVGIDIAQHLEVAEALAERPDGELGVVFHSAVSSPKCNSAA
jgi:hypothetical protein